MRLVAVPVGSEHFPAVCDKLTHFAERSGGEWTEMGLHSDLMGLRKQAYAVTDNGEVVAVGIGHTGNLPGGGVFGGLLACTGERMTEWVHLMADLEARAKANGCTVMRHRARPGWARVLAPQGYRETHRIIEKVL